MSFLTGVRKFISGIIAAGLGMWAFSWLSETAKDHNFYTLLLFLAACLGIYGYFNYKEHRINNGNGK